MQSFGPLSRRLANGLTWLGPTPSIRSFSLKSTAAADIEFRRVSTGVVRHSSSSSSHRSFSSSRTKWTFKKKTKTPTPPSSSSSASSEDSASQPSSPSGGVPHVPTLSPSNWAQHTQDLQATLRDRRNQLRNPESMSNQDIEVQTWRDIEAKLRESRRMDGVGTVPVDPNLPWEGEGIVTRETKIVQPEERSGKDPEKASAVNRRIRLTRRIGKAIEMTLSQKIWEMEARAPDKQDPFVLSLKSHGFQVNSIRLSRDLRQCTVRWTISQTLDPETVHRLLHHTPQSVLPKALDFGQIIQGMLDKYSKEIQFVIARDMELKHAPAITFIHDWRSERDQEKAQEFRNAARMFRKQRRAIRLELLQRQGISIPEEHRPHMNLRDQMTGPAPSLGQDSSATSHFSLDSKALEQIEELQEMKPEEREKVLLKMLADQK